MKSRYFPSLHSFPVLSKFRTGSVEQHVSNAKILLMELESVKKIPQIDARVEPCLSDLQIAILSSVK